MRSNLIPTVVVDKNNKTTTVHKRNGAPSPATGKLGSLKPTITKAPKAAVSKLVFGVDKPGVKNLSYGPGSFLDRAGLVDKAMGLIRGSDGKWKEFSVEIADDVLYDYLRLGIGMTEATVLHKLNNGDMDKMLADPDFAAALPGDLATQRVWAGLHRDPHPVDQTVDFLAEAGIKPAKITATLKNNMHDKILENNVLAPEQLVELFDRFAYSISKDETRGTAASRMMDAVIDGRLPFELIHRESKIDRPISSIAYDLLHSNQRKFAKQLSPKCRQELIDNPELLVQVCHVMSAHKLSRHETLETSYEAVKEYGFDTCMAYNPYAMGRKRIDGSFVGPEGVQAMNEVERILIEHVGTVRKDARTQRRIERLMRIGDHYQLHHDDLEPVDIWIEDVASMASLGYTPEQTADKLLKERVNLQEFVAVNSGKVSRIVVDGWL